MNNQKNIYYTNSTGIEMTNIDIKLKIDYKMGEEIINQCEIVFSPEQAKLTKIILEKAIDDYEKNFRKLNIPVNIEKKEGEQSNNAKK